MLDAHPEIAIPGPTFFLPRVLQMTETAPAVWDEFLHEATRSETWGDHHVSAEDLYKCATRFPFAPEFAARQFYQLYAGRFNKKRWGDSTQRYGYNMELIATHLEEARFIHIIRDGRDAAAAARLAHGWRALDGIEGHAAEWLRRTCAIWQGAAKCAHYMEIRFEHLVTYPPRVLSEVCEFLELPYSPAMLMYSARAANRLSDFGGIQRKYGFVSAEERMRGTYAEIIARVPAAQQIGRWRLELSREEALSYESRAGVLLDELGYRRLQQESAIEKTPDIH